MNVQVKVSDKVVVQADGDTPFDIFKKIVSLQEAFGEGFCRKCKHMVLKYQVREAQDKKNPKKIYQYPEIICLNSECRAKITLSQTDDGILYPARYWKKKNSEGEYEYIRDENGKKKVKGNWGWTIYNPETGQEE